MKEQPQPQPQPQHQQPHIPHSSQEASLAFSSAPKTSSPIPTNILPLSFSHPLLSSCGSTTRTLSTNHDTSTNSNSILATSSSSSLNDKFTLPAMHQRGNSKHKTTHPGPSNPNRKGQYSNDSVMGAASSFQDDQGRVLCCDQKAFLDHLRPKSLVLSVSFKSLSSIFSFM